nr:MAG TPA: hypothetical protein [Caudoviricetes sp.]
MPAMEAFAHEHVWMLMRGIECYLPFYESS